MQTEQLAYVTEQLNRGVDREVLRSTLLTHGYTDEHIATLFSLYESTQSSPANEAAATLTSAGTPSAAQLEYVKTQRALGSTDAAISETLRANGYDPALIAALLGGDSPQPSASPTTSVIGFFEMLRAGWNIVSTNWGIFGAYILAMVLSFALIFAIGAGILLSTLGVYGPAAMVGGFNLAMMGTAAAMLIGIYLVAIVVGNVLGVSLLRAIAVRNTGAGYWRSFAWGWGHVLTAFFALIYIQILTNLAFVTFIIPGVIVMVYLLMTFPVIVSEERRPLDAMIRSIELVYGNWWRVFGRLLGMIAVLVGVFLVGAFVLASSVMLGPLTILFFVVFYVGIFVAMYWLMATMIALFESLQARLPAAQFDASDHTTIRWWLRAILIVAVLVPLLGITLFFNSFMTALQNDPASSLILPPLADEVPPYDEFQQELEFAQIYEPDSIMQDSVSTLWDEAKEYYARAADATELGTTFCDEPIVTSTMDDLADQGLLLLCAATSTQFILEGELATGDWFCVDSTGAALDVPWSRIEDGFMRCSDEEMSSPVSIGNQVQATSSPVGATSTPLAP